MLPISTQHMLRFALRTNISSALASCLIDQMCEVLPSSLFNKDSIIKHLDEWTHGEGAQEAQDFLMRSVGILTSSPMKGQNYQGVLGFAEIMRVNCFLRNNDSGNVCTFKHTCT
jgi:hypothetical protein